MQKIKKAAVQYAKKNIERIIEEKSSNLICVDVSGDDYCNIEEKARNFEIEELLFPISSGKIILKNYQKEKNVFLNIFLVLDFSIDKNFFCKIDFFKMCIPAIQEISFDDFLENGDKYLRQKTTSKISDGKISFFASLSKNEYLYKDPIFSNSYMEILSARGFDDDSAIKYIEKENLMLGISKAFELSIDAFFTTQKIIIYLLMNAEGKKDFGENPRSGKGEKQYIKKIQTQGEKNTLADEKIIDLKHVKISIKNKKDLQNIRKYTRKCKSWNVRGHFRHYKNGKIVFVQSYQKGTEKNKTTTIYNI